MNSMSRPKPSRDLECQVATWEPQGLSNVYHEREFSIVTEFARNSAVWASQWRAHAYRARPTLSRHKFLPTLADLSRHRIAPPRHNFSLPWPTLLRPKNTQSRQKIFLAWPIMSQHRISLSQHKTSPFGHTLSRHKIFCCDRKLLASPTLSQ